MRVWILCCAASLSGCGSSGAVDPTDATTSETGDAITDVAEDVMAEVATDALAPLRSCPTSGKGAVAGEVCFLLTPAESGLPASGVNATVDQYALRPTSSARGKLVVFFNGSGGSPLAGTRGSPSASFYATARAAGLHVFAVSYRSDDAIGTLCKGADDCFLPTRRTVMTGVFETGAAAALSGIAVHEGALARLVAGLTTLAARDPSGGWGLFLDASATKPGDKVRWSNVIAAGHSQGGGHAALIGKTFAVDRVVALSSPCDMTTSGPATWLDATKSTYATAPSTSFHGLGAPGDAICSGYSSIWEALGMATSRRHADATICAGSAAHGASLECVENAPAWTKMLE